MNNPLNHLKNQSESDVAFVQCKLTLMKVAVHGKVFPLTCRSLRTDAREVVDSVQAGGSVGADRRGQTVVIVDFTQRTPEPSRAQTPPLRHSSFVIFFLGVGVSRTSLFGF